MWQDFEVERFEGLVPYQDENTFANTYEWLIAIAERQYDLIFSAELTFPKFFSKVCFVWYIIQIFYGRCIPFPAHRIKARFNDKRFRDYIRSDNYPVPVTIAEYFRLLGCPRTSLEHNIELCSQIGLTDRDTSNYSKIKTCKEG